MEKYVKYYLWNFLFMFGACLIVDLITYFTRGTTDILASGIIAGISAGLFTVFYYYKNK